MALLAFTPGERDVIGCIATLSCLSLALLGCDGSPSQGRGAGDAALPVLEDGGWSEAGSTRDGTSGDAESSDARRGDVETGAESCVNVSGAGDEPWFDLTVVGTGFDADEGKRMRIVVATQTGNRVGVADLPIVNGAFTLTLPEVLNAGWYVGVALYVDRNDNDTCETDEHVWEWATRIIMGDMQFEVTPDELCDPSLMGCRRHQPLRQACWVGSGETKLTEALPCIP